MAMDVGMPLSIKQRIRATVCPRLRRWFRSRRYRSQILRGCSYLNAAICC